MWSPSPYIIEVYTHTVTKSETGELCMWISDKGKYVKNNSILHIILSK